MYFNLGREDGRMEEGRGGQGGVDSHSLYYFGYWFVIWLSKITITLARWFSLSDTFPTAHFILFVGYHKF